MTDRMSTPDRTLRQEQGDAVRDRLLDAALTIIEGGGEPTMRSVAKAGGVSERTIYRYFESHDALTAALVPKLAGRAGCPLCGSAAELPAYARTLFEIFENNTALITGLLTGAWAAAHMRGTRRGNLAGLRALLDAAYPDAPVDARSAATSTLRLLLSGAGWHYLRVSCGLAQADVLRHALWSLAVIETSLRHATR